MTIPLEQSVLLATQVILAGVFVLAATMKLRDQPGARQTVVEFGVPPKYAASVALALPIVELAIAVTLFPSTTARWAALGAFGLLAMFSIAVGLML